MEEALSSKKPMLLLMRQEVQKISETLKAQQLEIEPKRLVAEEEEALVNENMSQA